MATIIYSSFKDIVQYYLLNLRTSWKSQNLPDKLIIGGTGLHFGVETFLSAVATICNNLKML